MKSRLKRILRLMWEREVCPGEAWAFVHVSVPEGEWLGTQVAVYWHKDARKLGTRNGRDFWVLSEKAWGKYRGRRLMLAEELAQYTGLKIHRRVGR